jgi:hypothetical protein
MRNILCISDSTTPCDEECAQIGSLNYTAKARAEGERFIALIREKLGAEPEGATLFLKGNPHDYGTYYTVECRYDEDLPETVKYAFLCERRTPINWAGDLPPEET